MSDEKHLSMDELARAANIAYDTLSIFLRKHGSRIPSAKIGRTRFFPPRAIEIVLEIVRENAARRGRHLRRRSAEKAASEEALAYIERAAAKATESLGRACELLVAHPFTVVISLRTLAPGLAFRHPVDVLIELDGRACVARLLEVGLSASGETRQKAMDSLRAVIVETYREQLERTDEERWTEPENSPSQWGLLDQLIRPARKRRRDEQSDVLSAVEGQPDESR
ncbi:MAG TPA: hypothetical protein VF173_32165 [Thermoanaerobaculia bacterium]|nr:hypothetical protein [Thermoanaerobaculia bacterium]